VVGAERIPHHDQHVRVQAGRGRTRVTLRGEFPSAEERARVIREYGADKGLVQTLARLAEYVAGMKNRPSIIAMLVSQTRHFLHRSTPRRAHASSTVSVL
jgi:hypothetical protein